MITLSACLTNDCCFRCSIKTEGYCCAAGLNRSGVDRKTMLEFNPLIKWKQKFLPDNPIHITGGEPFIHPGIKQGLIDCVKAGFDLTLFTNGYLLAKNSWAYDLPIKWCVTQHPGQMNNEQFLEAIRPLKDRPHIVCRIFHDSDVPPFDIMDLYGDFNAKWVKANRGYYNFVERDVDNPDSPNCWIILIGKDGKVHSCSVPHADYGNVYDMTFDIEKAKKWHCPAGIFPTGCHTMQNAILFQEMGIVNK